MGGPPAYSDVPIRVVVQPERKTFRICISIWSIIIGTVWIAIVSYFVFIHMRWWIKDAECDVWDPLLVNTTTTENQPIPNLTTNLLTTTTANLPVCDQGWTPIVRQDLRTMCAKLFTSELAGMDYYPAMDFCKKFEAVLAPMEGTSEREALMNMVKAANLQDGSIWIGAHRQNGVFLWELDKKPVVSANWDTGEANMIDKDPDCIQVITKSGEVFGKWNDILCTNEALFWTHITGGICAKYLN